MKKTTLALILCFVLVVFAFASCAKNNKNEATTADPGTTPATTVVPTEPEATEPEATEHVHTPEDDFEVLSDATCSAPGLKVRYCLECGQEIEREEIPIDPNAHNVETWTGVEPTLLSQSGYRDGTCTRCNQQLHEDLVWAPAVYNTSNPSGPYYNSGKFIVSKSTEDIRGDNHFCPTEGDPDGNDLWFEYSFLWNESFANWIGLAEMEVAGLWNADGRYAHHRPLFYCYMRDGVKDYCPYAAHFDYTTHMPGLGSGVFLDPGNGQKIYLGGHDDVLTEESHPSLGEYGWHRIGVHFHQEVAEYDEAKGGTVYAGYHELFIDGVKVWKILSNIQGRWTDNSWNTNSGKDMKSTNCMLWTAEYDGVNWTYSENNVSVKVYMDANLSSALGSVYVVVDDPIWTCGSGFALNVEPNPTPTETTITLAEGVEVPGTVYFKLAD